MVVVTLIVGVMAKLFLRKTAVPFTLIMLLFGVAFGILIESGECVWNEMPCSCSGQSSPSVSVCSCFVQSSTPCLMPSCVCVGSCVALV